MIRYDVHCFCCKQTFQVVEGTQKYQYFKRNRNGKFACPSCEDKVYSEARANLFSKLRS
jgi:hypothetical protein